MFYTQEQIDQLDNDRETVLTELQSEYLSLVSEFAPSLKIEKAREYTRQGVARRLKILRKCIENIAAIYPPARHELLSEDECSDVAINLHAFITNIDGVQDNIAWVYVIENALEDKIKNGPVGVGLFTKETKPHLPADFRTYLKSDRIKEWRCEYAKNFRDALTHRIPPYLPPYEVTQSNTRLCQALASQIHQLVLIGDFKSVKTLLDDCDSYRRICPTFLHSLSGSDPSPPIILHPQVLADANTVLEIVRLAKKHIRKGPDKDS